VLRFNLKRPYSTKEKVMSKLDVVRAWKDEQYRSSLTAEENAMLPANPAGAIELSDAEVSFIAGGVVKSPPVPQKTTVWACTLPTMVCPVYTC
jgi:mersacidin/lichenicidin family type 2 lantibiotic